MPYISLQEAFTYFFGMSRGMITHFCLCHEKCIRASKCRYLESFRFCASEVLEMLPHLKMQSEKVHCKEIFFSSKPKLSLRFPQDYPANTVRGRVCLGQRLNWDEDRRKETSDIYIKPRMIAVAVSFLSFMYFLYLRHKYVQHINMLVAN